MSGAELRGLRKASYVARGLTGVFGRRFQRRFPRPPLPRDPAPLTTELGHLKLHMLPLGWVRIREWHRELPQELSDLSDDLRFIVMMADRTPTPWIACVAWVIEHPERTILVDTGETLSFGTSDYFDNVPRSQAFVYPRIIDGTALRSHNLRSGLNAIGMTLQSINLCVLTHTHSDHVGNLGELSRNTQVLIAPEELAPTTQSGRLLTKLPRDGRLTNSQWVDDETPFGRHFSLTLTGEVSVVPTPGHTIGHQSVRINLGGSQVIVAGDLAFSDLQVRDNLIPGIVESRQKTLATYDRLRRASLQTPTTSVFTHDDKNASKLAALTL